MGSRSKGASKHARHAKRLQFETLEPRVVLSASSIVPTEPVAPPETVQAPMVTLNSVEDWVHSLTYQQFNQLTALESIFLRADQLGTIPSTSWYLSMSAAARAALGPTQIPGLDTERIRITSLLPAQVGMLTGDQIRSLQTINEFAQLAPSQIHHLSVQQVGGITTTGVMDVLPAALRAEFTMPQVRALNFTSLRLNRLTPTQISWLLTWQIETVSSMDFSLLSSSQTPKLLGTQIGLISSVSSFQSWLPAAREALTQTQIPSLNVAVVRLTLLTPTQISWLSDQQIRSLQTMDFAYLAPAQIPKLTTQQVAGLNTTGLMDSLLAASRAELTKPQVQAINFTAVRLNRLTTQQISWITAPQIRQLTWLDFEFLGSTQTPYLTTAQIASIPNATAFGYMSALARGALSATQVRAISNVALKLNLLKTSQIAVLRTVQVQSLAYGEFGLLSPSQIPLLTAAQVASIPSTGTLTSLPDAIRNALTLPQIQALSTAVVRISSLTPEQIGWLTIQQIRALSLTDFKFLNATQIPLLTAQQVGQFTTVGTLGELSAAARAALTPAQVRLLNVQTVRLNNLTPEQVSWLRDAQLRSLQPIDFVFLNASQIPKLSVQQFTGVTVAGMLTNMADDLLAALSREQILAIPKSSWEDFVGAMGAPTNYHPVIHTEVGPDGISTADHIDAERDKFLSIVPINLASNWTIASGNWSSAATWRYGVPAAGAKVHIAAGHTVQFDVEMTSDLGWLRIDGKLNFATNRNTVLKADTVVVATTGILHIGTAAIPIHKDYTARIVIADNGAINTVLDPNSLGRGVLSRGEVRMYGKAVTPYGFLTVAPEAGDTTLTLTSVPENWRVGDRLVVSGSVATRPDFGADEVTILAINGSVITVEPLQYYHTFPEGYGLTLQVANMTRNIRFESENPAVPTQQRPHMVFFHNPNVEIQNIGVYDFGRTDKSIRINDPTVVNGVLQPGTGLNNRARYAIHFHHTGVNPNYESVKISGSLIVGSPGWGFVNHSSNVDFVNNVAYDIYGASFATEDGNEIGSFVGNLSMNARGSLDTITDRRDIHDFGFKGHGFWLQGPGVEVIDNISAGSLAAGFSFFQSSGKTLFDAVNLPNAAYAGGQEVVPIDSVPFATFNRNTTYAAKSGLEIWHSQRHMTDAFSVIDNFTSWNTRVAGIDVFYSSHIEVRNAILLGNLNTFEGGGITHNRFTHDMVFTNVTAIGFEVGINMPVRRSSLVNGGYFAALHAIYIDKGYDTVRSALITGPIVFANATAAQRQNRTQYDVYASGAYKLIDFTRDVSVLSMLAHDDIVYAPNGAAAVRIDYYGQLKGAVPFSAEDFTGLLPDDYFGKTNAQLMTEFGVSFGGEVLDPADAATVPRIYGLTRPAL